MTRRNPLQAVLSLTFVAAMALAGCAPVVNNHGFLAENEVIGRIQPGTTTRTEVAELLGTPTSVAAFDENTWLYISRRTEQQFQFLDPRVVDQTVLAITFDGGGRVAQMRRMGEQDGREVDFVGRATPSPGKELSVWEQFVGNVGRFNSARREGSGQGGGN